MADEKKDQENKNASNVDETRAADQVAEDLDLDELDLSVETVEERISPSETNVFDK